MDQNKTIIYEALDQRTRNRIIPKCKIFLIPGTVLVTDMVYYRYPYVWICIEKYKDGTVLVEVI